MICGMRALKYTNRVDGEGLRGRGGLLNIQDLIEDKCS
jgi:hypothetical protein